MPEDNKERVKRLIAEAKRRREEAEALKKTQGGGSSAGSEAITALQDEYETKR